MIRLCDCVINVFIQVKANCSRHFARPSSAVGEKGTGFPIRLRRSARAPRRGDRGSTPGPRKPRRVSASSARQSRRGADRLAACGLAVFSQLSSAGRWEKRLRRADRGGARSSVRSKREVPRPLADSFVEVSLRYLSWRTVLYAVPVAPSNEWLQGRSLVPLRKSPRADGWTRLAPHAPGGP